MLPRTPVSQKTGLLPRDFHHSLGGSVLAKPKLGDVPGVTQARAFAVVQPLLSEGEHSGSAGNLNAGVPVTSQSCLLVWGEIMCVAMCSRYI